MRRSAGRLLARGNTSNVHEWTAGAVIKVLRPGIPTGWARLEATAMDEARKAGLPVPTIHDVINIKGRTAIVMERIVGETLSERMTAHPDETDHWLKTLAGLQQQVSRQPGLGALPSLKDRLEANISDAGVIPTEARDRLLEILEALPDERFMCHFDFHPSNVIIGPAGPVIIDWFDAAAGDPAADLVRTAMLLRYGAASAHGPEASGMMARIHRGYVTHIARHPDVDIDSLLAWEAVVMGARLAEPIPDQLVQVTYGDLTRALAGESRLLMSLRESRVAA